MGFVIVTAIPFLHYLLFSGGYKAKLIYIALIPPLLYAMILTMSRGAFVAFLIVGFMVFKESKHKFGLVLLAGVMLVAALSVMTPAQTERYFSLFSSESKSSATVDGRMRGIRQEFILGFNRPIVGHGIGTTPEAKFHTYGKSQASHNMYGEILIEVGFIGAFFFFRFMLKIYQGMSYSRKLLDENAGDGMPQFYVNLNTALVCVFWMFAAYSLNYWGLSQYYWYLFGGLVLAFCRLVQNYKVVDDQNQN